MMLADGSVESRDGGILPPPPAGAGSPFRLLEQAGVADADSHPNFRPAPSSPSPPPPHFTLDISLLEEPTNGPDDLAGRQERSDLLPLLHLTNGTHVEPTNGLDGLEGQPERSDLHALAHDALLPLLDTTPADELTELLALVASRTPECASPSVVAQPASMAPTAGGPAAGHPPSPRAPSERASQPEMWMRGSILPSTLDATVLTLLTSSPSATSHRHDILDCLTYIHRVNILRFSQGRLAAGLQLRRSQGRVVP